MTLPVVILDKDAAIGAWVQDHLKQIGVTARWLPTLPDLLAEAEAIPPSVCLIALRPPVGQALHLVTELAQEPRFARTALILMGPAQHKHSAFEAGAHDYLVTPPDVIELRKRVRLHLSRAELEARLIAETAIIQEIDARGGRPLPADQDKNAAISLLEHVAALTHERDLFETVLRWTDAALALLSREGALLYANPAWMRVTARERSLQPDHRLHWPPTPADPGAQESLNEALAHSRPWSGDVRLNGSGPDPRAAELHVMPVQDAADEGAGFVLLVLPDSARRAADASKLRFLSDAIMEMRTPVTNIKMREYLLHQAPMLQRDTHLQALEQETDRLSRMVDAMLELSRLDTGAVQMTCEDVDLGRLVREALVRYGPAAAEHGVTLTCSSDRSPLVVHADSLYLARALGILVDNAIQHTPGGGQVVLTWEQESWTGGDFATIAVKDSGIGIDADALPHLFERFFRTDRARAAGIHGIGLGLSIAYEIAIQLGGHITVESEVNRGSIFTLWVPLVTD